jgi:crotonobetainyl-CoA:carnitine CoA-transferase CaiB-like acyl-CoA transferase
VDHRPALPRQAARSVNRDSLNAEINRRLAEQDRAHWIERSTTVAWPAATSTTCRRCWPKPQVQHLGMVQDVVSPHLGPQRWWASQCSWSARPATIARAAPRRGEHTEEVLRELGLWPSDLARTEIQEFSE